ncbi:MAG: tRNA (5-methylaminomethyl-2-thiouridine)(34)-methyltransferase MnmD [Alphaproteobacteria bacterium]|nr:tRNA (5-methylaminomethyl-2-thiouridine)(34)-methyltransferase MnmD [Alphaproteobacteria bacterium]
MPSDQHQSAKIDWSPEGVPVSHRFDDPYFSIHNGLEETRHVFLNGNDLPHRLNAGFQIAELGFGTGLNLLATWLMWHEDGRRKPLSFTSFEAFPMAANDIQKALETFPEVAKIARRFLDHWSQGETNFDLAGLKVEIIIGDANTTLRNWPHKADAWFLDGFSPTKNPELWRADLLAEVAAHTNPNGTLATYSAAGHIRRTLANVGFSIDRAPGYGHKRHMSKGVLKDPA